MARRFSVIQGGLSEAVAPEGFAGGTPDRRAAVALAWSREGDGPKTFRSAGAKAMDRATIEAVDAALRRRLDALRLRRGPAASRDAKPHPAPARIAPSTRRRAGAGEIPAGAFVGVRPEGWEPAEAASA